MVIVSELFETCIGLVVVGILWGATNPLIKKGSAGIEKIKARNSFLQFVYEVKFLVTNWKYMLPFLLNQSGSVVYFFALQKTDLSLAVPVANSLTFVFTALAGMALGEESPGRDVYLGMLLVVAGISLCVLDKTLTAGPGFEDQRIDELVLRTMAHTAKALLQELMSSQAWVQVPRKAS